MSLSAAETPRRTGRPRTCECGNCAKCLHRDKERSRWNSLTPDERRAAVALRNTARSNARQRAVLAKHTAANDEWYKRKKERDRQWRSRTGYDPRKLNPVAAKARSKFQKQVSLGKIKRQPCEVCGAPNAQGHHEDYSRPLDVTWLCSKHHGERHRKAA